MTKSNYEIKYLDPKDSLILEGILALVPSQKKGAKPCPWVESLNNLFSVKGRKFKLSAQGRNGNLLPGNGTKLKISSEIKLPLI